jgi:NTP pyrophosphatase (non-canonical NTP hydrolase)
MDSYQQFVQEQLNPCGMSAESLIDRIKALESAEGKVPQLITAALGLSGEAGEFTDCVKKLLLHGKPLDAEMRQDLCLELGDVAFYWVVACLALDKNPQEILDANVQKLRDRRSLKNS